MSTSNTFTSLLLHSRGAELQTDTVRDTFIRMRHFLQFMSLKNPITDMLCSPCRRAARCQILHEHIPAVCGLGAEGFTNSFFFFPERKKDVAFGALIESST